MTSPERRAAEVFLSELHLLLLAWPDVAADMVRRLECAVTACARVGLLPPADAEIRRARAQRLTTPRGRPPRPVKQAALGHLEAVRERGDRLGLQAATTAFEQGGLLTSRQAFEWRFSAVVDVRCAVEPRRSTGAGPPSDEPRRDLADRLVEDLEAERELVGRDRQRWGDAERPAHLAQLDDVHVQPQLEAAGGHRGAELR